MTKKELPSIVGSLNITEPEETLSAEAYILEMPPDDHPVYNRIGRVVSFWSHVEHMLDVIIWKLSDCDPEKGACITGQISGYVPRMNIIIGLLIAKKLDTALIEQAHKLMDKMRSPSQERNRFVHDTWWLRPANDALF